MPISTNDLLKLKEYSDYFIETGSHKGKTIDKAISCNFKKIKSIEFDYELYVNCLNKYKEDERVSLFYGSSAKILQFMIFNIHERAVFWLDAHYSGSGSSMDKEICPILKELDAIKNHSINNHIILIDDIRLFKITGKNINNFSGHFEISLDEVICKLKEVNNKYHIKYIDGFMKNDVLMALPPDVVKSYKI